MPDYAQLVKALYTSRSRAPYSALLIEYLDWRLVMLRRCVRRCVRRAEYGSVYFSPTLARYPVKCLGPAYLGFGRCKYKISNLDTPE